MQQRLRHAKCSSTVQSNKTLNGCFSLFRSEAVSLYSSPPEKSKNHIPFINFISLFCRGELCSPLCFCFKKNGRNFRPLLFTFQSRRDSNSRRVFQAGRTHPQGIPHLEKHCTGLALSSCTLCQEYKNHMQEWSFAHLFPFE